jgi:hypothetical protein
MYHGWNLYAETFWSAEPSASYGIYNKALTTKALLEGGFAVITPNAEKNAEMMMYPSRNSSNNNNNNNNNDQSSSEISSSSAKDDGGYWYTNIPPFDSDLSKWPESDDSPVITAILDGIAAGDFGPLDPQHLHAAGFSSGAYMTSRMAFSYTKHFLSLSIQSGSYYYCDGACDPTHPNGQDAPGFASHPPTLFLHGEADPLVPPETSLLYYQTLLLDQVPTRRVTQKGARHEWIDAAPNEILAWVQKYNQ